jgi:hypothetical protein
MFSVSVAVENRKQEFTFLYFSAPGTVEYVDEFGC